MNKKTVKMFYEAYGYEPTESEQTTIKDMMGIWAKMEKSVAKNPAILRKGIVFGLGLAISLLAENGQSKRMNTVTASNDM